MKIWGVRQSLLGDSIGALPVLNALERMYPGSYKYWHLAQKCSHLAPLLIGHPLIDKIVFSDCEEGFGPKDRELMGGCNIVINTMPPHPDDRYPNDFNFYEENFRMAGLPLELYYQLPKEEKYPQLVKWFRNEDLGFCGGRKKIGIFPFAGYGKEPRRSPTREWYEKLICLLIENNYEIFIFGHPNDPQFCFNLEPADLSRLHFHRGLDFFTQIRQGLACETVITTDSGTGLIFAAYGHKQVSLIAAHWPGHVRNLLSLAPVGINTHTFFGEGGADNIDRDTILDKIKSISQ